MRQNIWRQITPSLFMFTVGTPWHSQEPASTLQALSVFNSKFEQQGAHISYCFLQPCKMRLSLSRPGKGRRGDCRTLFWFGDNISPHWWHSWHTRYLWILLFSGTVLDFHLISVQTSSSALLSDKHLATSFSVNWKHVIFRDTDTPHFTSAQRFERGSPSQLLELVIERDFCLLSK